MTRPGIRQTPFERHDAIRQAFVALETDQPQAVLNFAHQALIQGESCVLVTLVGIIDSAPKTLGAQMAVRGDGGYCGYVSGGCLEAAAAAEALDVLVQGEDRIVRFGKGSSYFDIQLPCGGGIDLAFHILRDVAPLAETLSRLEERGPACLSYDLQSFSLEASVGAHMTGWDEDVFRRVYQPELKFRLIGKGHEARVFQQVAQSAGYQVDATDGPIGACDSLTAVIFLTHDLERETDLLCAALETEAGFIGCLGGRKTHARRVESLREAGCTGTQIARIHAPIGLFGPARDANSLAVSVLAQVLALRSHRTLSRPERWRKRRQ